jgi:PilZ domain
MGERRKTRRFEVYLPVQVCFSHHHPAEFFTAQLRDISRTGIYFHSTVAMDPGAGMELTFALPTEKDQGASVLVRASANAIRVSSLQGDLDPLYGVAASIDRIDFVRPVVASASAA